MSQALNNLKKLIIEVVEKEVSTNEYANTQAKKKKQKGLEEELNLFLEKNTPTNPSKWSYYKSQAKKKFDVYPSAYANAWAAKQYKAAGGGWKKEQIGEASMTGNLDGGEGPPQTPYAFQSKKKRAQDKKKEDDISTNSTGFTKVNEVTKQEVNALRNLVKGIGNLKKDFSKATYIGDKELRKKDYNKHYETLLDAEKAMVKLMQLFKNKEMLGEGLNEGKNDKILDKIADIVKGASSFMNIGRELDKNRIKYTFGTKMIPMYIIEKPVKIVIINKKYVSGAERVVGSTAIGVMESIKESINEGRYHDWRNDESLTPKQKIGRSIREVRNSLNELNKTINMNLKLKNELQVDSRDYWKTTHKALSGISEKLVKLAGKVGNLK
jgi:hypothetical protein